MAAHRRTALCAAGRRRYGAIFRIAGSHAPVWGAARDVPGCFVAQVLEAVAAPTQVASCAACNMYHRPVSGAGMHGCGEQRPAWIASLQSKLARALPVTPDSPSKYFKAPAKETVAKTSALSTSSAACLTSGCLHELHIMCTMQMSVEMADKEDLSASSQPMHRHLGSGACLIS